MTTSFLIRVTICAASAIAAGMLCLSSSWAQGGAPRYEADLNWPKPLPDRWVLGGLGGVCVDAQDHVLILNRQDVLVRRKITYEVAVVAPVARKAPVVEDVDDGLTELLSVEAEV